jgi:hypothetical protein
MRNAEYICEMLNTLLKRVCAVAGFAAVLYEASVSSVKAQAAPAALPTAPGADRAVSGGLSEAHPSLPGGPGLSPLEPYLILWLLPASGLVTVFAGIYADRRTQARTKQLRVSPGRPSTTVRRSV